MGLWITCRDQAPGHARRGFALVEQKTSSFKGLCTNAGDQLVDNLGVDACRPCGLWLAGFCTLFDQRLRIVSQASML